MATIVDQQADSDPKRMTKKVFDSIGAAYEQAFSGLPEQSASLHWLLAQLSSANYKSAKCLDIGCGTGKPVCSTLADAGHDVLGIDISSVMINAAQDNVPNAKFEILDVRDLRSREASWDVITVYFSLIAGVTPSEIKQIIAQIHHWLKPGGFFVFATVPLAADMMEIRWMGRPVVVSSLPPEEAVDTVKNVGFEVIHNQVTNFLPKAVEAGICAAEDVWEEPHLFVYARKPIL